MRRLLYRFTTMAALLAGLLGLTASGLTFAAGTPSLIATPSSREVAQNSVLQVSLAVHTNTASFDTLNVTAHFPMNKLTFVGIDKAGSAFSTFIPTSPTAGNGQVSFAAAALGETTVANNAVVATLLFKATTATGTATIDFTGTKAASGGSAIDVDTSPVTVQLTTASGGSAQTFTISDVRISNVSMNSANLSWQTTVPTSGSVDFGLSTRYGLTASSGSGESHTVKLTGLFSPKSTVHYRIVATNAAGNIAQTNDSSFTTKGYSILITVVNAHKQPLQNQQVKLGSGQSGTTNSAGQVLLQDVAPGTQDVTIGHGKSQTIVVKAEPSSEASTPQTFTLKPAAMHYAWPLFGIIAIVVLLILWLIIDINRKHHTTRPTA